MVRDRLQWKGYSRPTLFAERDRSHPMVGRFHYRGSSAPAVRRKGTPIRAGGSEVPLGDGLGIQLNWVDLWTGALGPGDEFELQAGNCH